MSWFGLASYGGSAIVFAAMTVFLLASHPGGRNATWVTAAAAVSMLWSIAMLLPAAPLVAFVLADAVHMLVWTACVLSWLGPRPAGQQHWSVRARVVGLGAMFGIWAAISALYLSKSGAAASAADAAANGYSFAHQSIYLTLIGMGLAGLLAVEQVFRNAHGAERNGVRPFCFATGAIFAINVFVYSQASLLGSLVPLLWEGRGIANAALAPFVIVALKRRAEWERELFVSRHVVFYTASLVVVGIYLLAMSAVGYIIRLVGGEWGLPLEIAFLLIALAILVYGLFSSSIRARVKVFLVKHFYRNKYDYRQEWIRLTSALSANGDLAALSASSLEGIARIVGSREASLWLASEQGSFEEIARLDGPPDRTATYDVRHPIVEFMREKGWVIDSDEYRREPERYRKAFGNPEDGLLPKDSIIVPLDCQGYLQGFVLLAKPPGVESLNFEDHDILKTAGRQVAVVLAQALAQQQLTATRQFEAVNKLVTFLMHDLQNVVAQQELVVANAQRFRHRPEFIDDAIETIRSGVERMRKVLEQLKKAAQEAGPQRSRADVSKVVMEVRSQCSDREPVPEIDAIPDSVWVEMEREKLASVLTHLVRNAQDATPPEGRIVVSLECRDDVLVISVADTGEGMDRTFIRERLFRPFDSTKGAKGMGIGAYQVRETVRAAGGDVEVDSELGRGTRFSVRLPLARSDGSMLSSPSAA